VRRQATSRRRHGSRESPDVDANSSSRAAARPSIGPTTSPVGAARVSRHRGSSTVVDDLAAQIIRVVNAARAQA